MFYSLSLSDQLHAPPGVDCCVVGGLVVCLPLAHWIYAISNHASGHALFSFILRYAESEKLVVGSVLAFNSLNDFWNDRKYKYIEISPKVTSKMLQKQLNAG